MKSVLRSFTVVSVLLSGSALFGVERDEIVYPTSLVKLLVAPDEFVGKKTIVTGYLQQFSLRLFVTEDLAAANDSQSSILIADPGSGSLANSSCTGHYVSVQGRLVELDPGAYALAEVDRVQIAKNGEACWSNES